MQTRFPKDTLPFAEQTRFQRLTLDKVATWVQILSDSICFPCPRRRQTWAHALTDTLNHIQSRRYKLTYRCRRSSFGFVDKGHNARPRCSNIKHNINNLTCAYGWGWMLGSRVTLGGFSGGCVDSSRQEPSVIHSATHTRFLPYWGINTSRLWAADWRQAKTKSHQQKRDMSHPQPYKCFDPIPKAANNR